MFNFNEEKEVEAKSELKRIRPLKDFTIRFNEYSYDLKKDEAIEVHEMFLQNLKTEKVIKE